MIIESAQAKINKALEYAKLGFWPIRLHGVVNGWCTCGKVDCGSKGKHPNTPHGYKDATQEEAVIRRWWTDAPTSNLGLCPQPGQVAIDVDPKNDGDKTWAQWQEEHGVIARTPQSRTGSGGYHYLLTLPPGVVVKNTAGKVGPGVDLRSHGGLIVVEPSVTDKGGYSWIVPLSEPIAPCPEWLVDKIRVSKGFKDDPSAKPQADPKEATAFVWGEDRANDFPSHPGTSSGTTPSRHDELCRLVGIHLNRGDSVRTIEAMAIEWACRCTPPIAEKDVLKTVRGLANKEAAKAHDVGEGAPGEGDLRSDPEPEAGDSGPAPASLGVSSQEPESSEEEEIDDWPRLDDDAFIGLAGEIVRAIEPETEADPVNVLLTLLGAFGNAIGRGAYMHVGPDRHHANLFVSIVGNTASRKGVGLGVVKWLTQRADPDWYEGDIGYGLSSGEGLIERVQDDPDGIETKRLWAIETEFVNLLLVKGREGNTLSAKLRNAWDGAPIESMTKSKKGLPPAKASRHHVSILGHITPKELAKAMTNSVDISNGFANRFLWTLVRRARYLPEGGNIEVLRPFIEPLREAIMKAREIGSCWRDETATALWREVYRDLSDSEEDTAGRAEPQALRLSLIYAMLDGTQVIGERHLRAALAVWRYCEESARRLFGGVDTPGGRGPGDMPLHLRLLDMIAKQPGIGRKALSQSLSSRFRANVGEELQRLADMRLAHPRIVATNGRPAEGWYPGPGEDPDADAKPESSAFTFTWDDGSWIGTKAPGDGVPQGLRPGDLSSGPAVQTQDAGSEVGAGDLSSGPAVQTQDAGSEVGAGDLSSGPAVQTQDAGSEAATLSSNEGGKGSTQNHLPEAEGREAESPAPASLGVSQQEPYSIEDDMSPEDRARHLEAQRSWREALADKVKAQAHRLDAQALARLSDDAYLDGIAKRLYVQCWRTRPDYRSSDPLPPKVDGDIQWIERYVGNLAKEEASLKALRKQDISDEEWAEEWRMMLAEAEAEEENSKISPEAY